MENLTVLCFLQQQFVFFQNRLSRWAGVNIKSLSFYVNVIVQVDVGEIFTPITAFRSKYIPVCFPTETGASDSKALCSDRLGNSSHCVQIVIHTAKIVSGDELLRAGNRLTIRIMFEFVILFEVVFSNIVRFV